MSRYGCGFIDGDRSIGAEFRAAGALQDICADCEHQRFRKSGNNLKVCKFRLTNSFLEAFQWPNA
jgi:hypothetical protein